MPTAAWHVCSYKKLPEDMKPGSQILCADGSIVMEVISTDPKAGTVRVKCLNNATLGCAPGLLTSLALPSLLLPAGLVTHIRVAFTPCCTGIRTLQKVVGVAGYTRLSREMRALVVAGRGKMSTCQGWLWICQL